MQTPTLVRRKADTPSALTDELVKAQQAFTAVKNSVISRASERRASIAEIQRDLAEEDQQLSEVVKAAQ